MTDYIYYQGSTFTVEWYRESSGRMKAKKYYEGISPEEQKRLDDIVVYFADSPLGTRLPKTLYNEEDAENKIYAFKPKDHRFFNFVTVGKKIIIVNAYRKHSQQMMKKDISLLKTVIASKNDYLLRVKGGTYYERHA
ncbi:MAG: hypothetical protein A3I11_00860 [Elusimicrobia bacterium RIFCSPLOWO2_02_FULL_39_32]|nr:MAG: hypothetical protein A2034_05630 [Elusimicrobia bacterium GWA2_38_7]OGR78992.1 MAG: hypothetical protein A3B80_07885 [Elusimicrobia bacterium RIFCSPHIGHO2_02_FULL_39_36]OGR92576.1 MAG: hypothetical protein A3I11_00860 [Elusimicrobia bacterium RIFCSPLOWO2_02_FULL_39_32]OGR99224.1 MAG: hypothetical protein A3G85_06070 [Elusimicrobia bacterium RIFCSPLOWO2_12_FULL_39_28]